MAISIGIFYLVECVAVASRAAVVAELVFVDAGGCDSDEPNRVALTGIDLITAYALDVGTGALAVLRAIGIY